MKGKDIIAYAVQAEMPDMEQLRQSCIKQATEKTTIKRGVRINRLFPIAACAVIMFTTVFALTHLRDAVPNANNNFDTNFEDNFW